MATSTTLRLHPPSLLRLLLILGFALALASFIVQLIFYQAPEFRGLNSLVEFTNVDGENSVPSWFSATQLFACSVILWIVAGLERSAGRPHVRSWLGLAVIFTLLSIDETVQFHELLSNILEETFDLSGFFYFAWVIPGALFVLVLAGLYLQFLWSLPARTRYLMLAAGGIFVCGALGVEAVTGRYVEVNGFPTRDWLR